MFDSNEAFFIRVWENPKRKVETEQYQLAMSFDCYSDPVRKSDIWVSFHSEFPISEETINKLNQNDHGIGSDMRRRRRRRRVGKENVLKSI